MSLIGHVHQMWAKVPDVGKARALISKGGNAPVSAGFLPACEVEVPHSVTQGVWFTCEKMKIPSSTTTAGGDV